MLISQEEERYNSPSDNKLMTKETRSAGVQAFYLNTLVMWCSTVVEITEIPNFPIGRTVSYQ